MIRCRTCPACRKVFPVSWNSCPACGKQGNNKYGAKTVRDEAGRVFQSIGESERFRNLTYDPRVLKGSLELHPTVILFPGKPVTKWRLDYRYFDSHLNAWVWEDFKGKETADFKLKVKMWKYLGPGILRLSRKHRNGFFEVYDEIAPLGMDRLVLDMKHCKAPK